MKKSLIPQNNTSFTKKEMQLSHKIVVLSELLINAIDELVISDKLPLKEIPEHPLNQSLEFCLKLSNRSNEFKEVRATNYLQELTHKVDTAVRKGFKPIETLETYHDYGNN